MRTVRARIDAPAADAQDGLREFSDRWHARSLEQRNQIARRAQLGHRRRCRIENIDDDFWRQLVPGGGGAWLRLSGKPDGRDNESDGDCDESTSAHKVRLLLVRGGHSI